MEGKPKHTNLRLDLRLDHRQNRLVAARNMEDESEDEEGAVMRPNYGPRKQCAQVGADLDLRARKKVKMSAFKESDSEQESEEEAGSCAPGPPASSRCPPFGVCPSSPGSANARGKANVIATSSFNTDSDDSSDEDHSPLTRSDGRPQSERSDAHGPAIRKINGGLEVDTDDSDSEQPHLMNTLLGEVVGRVLRTKRQTNGKHRRIPSIYRNRIKQLASM